MEHIDISLRINNQFLIKSKTPIYNYLKYLLYIIFISNLLFSLNSQATTVSVIEDDFNKIEVAQWSSFGLIKPSVEFNKYGRPDILNDGGTSPCESGLLSKNELSLPNGFILDSDVFISVPHENSIACAEMALTKDNNPIYGNDCQLGGYSKGVLLGIRYAPPCAGIDCEKPGESGGLGLIYVEAAVYTGNNNWEKYNKVVNNYINGWHKLRIIVNSDQKVEFYVDNNAIYTSTKKLDISVLVGKKLLVGGICGNGGQTYHDKVAIFPLVKRLQVPYFNQGYRNWCALNVAAMISQYYGINEHSWDLAHEFGITHDGGLQTDAMHGGNRLLKDHFNSKGLDAKVYYTNVLLLGEDGFFNAYIRNPLTENKPVMIESESYHHAILAVGYSIENGRKYVYIHDPAGYMFHDDDNMFIKVPYSNLYAALITDIPTGLVIVGGNPSNPHVAIYLKDQSIRQPDILHFEDNGNILDSELYLDRGIKIATFIKEMEGFPDIEKHSEYLRWYSNKEIKINSIYVSNPTSSAVTAKVDIILKEKDKEEFRGEIKNINIPKESQIMVEDAIPEIIFQKSGTKELYLKVYAGGKLADQIGPIYVNIVDPSCFWGTANCPVDVTIIDPDGLILSRINNSIPDSTYTEYDLNNDADLDDIFIIPNPKIGNYRLIVTPKTDAQPQDNFTLKVYLNDRVITLTDNLTIKDIPSQQYLVDVTPDIHVSMIAEPNSTGSGEIIDFIINITNTGKNPLNQVIATDYMPSGLSYISDNRSGVISEQNIHWNDLGSLQPGNSIHIHMVTRTNEGSAGMRYNILKAQGTKLEEDGSIVTGIAQTKINIISIDKSNTNHGLTEPVQFAQSCNQLIVEGSGSIDVSSSAKEKRIALQYNQHMSGKGDLTLDLYQAFSENPERLIRQMEEKNESLNFYEATKMTYEGALPLTGWKNLNSEGFYGDMAADIKEIYSIYQMDKDQQIFFGSNRNSSISQLICVDTLGGFNGTWITDATMHKILSNEVKSHQKLSGNFEIKKKIKFHENPKSKKEDIVCEDIDC